MEQLEEHGASFKRCSIVGPKEKAKMRKKEPCGEGVS